MVKFSFYLVTKMHQLLLPFTFKETGAKPSWQSYTLASKVLVSYLKKCKKENLLFQTFSVRIQWDIEKCETLWEDIKNFAETDAKKGSDYFLGTIVSVLEQ